MKITSSLIGMALVLMTGTCAFGDTTLEYRKTGGGRQASLKWSVLVGSGNVAGREGSSGGADTVYRSAERALYIMDHGSRTYSVIDEGVADQLTAQRTDSMKRADDRVKEQFGDLPPEKQQQVRMVLENVLKYSDPSAVRADKKRFIPLQKTARVGGYLCQAVEIHQGRKKVAELCLSRGSDLGVSKEDLSALNEFSSFTEEITSRLPGSKLTEYSLVMGNEAWEGIPVSVILYGENGSVTRYELSSVSLQPLPGDAFAVPAGYRQKAFSPDSPAS